MKAFGTVLEEQALRSSGLSVRALKAGNQAMEPGGLSVPGQPPGTATLSLSVLHCAGLLLAQGFWTLTMCWALQLLAVPTLSTVPTDTADAGTPA